MSSITIGLENRNGSHAPLHDVMRMSRSYNPGNSRHAQTLVEPNAFSQGKITIVSREFLPLLNPDRITTADWAAPLNGSIHTDVDLVMLGRRAQDSRILREIPLRESGHHTTPARTDDVQAHRRPDGERVADPGILRKAFLT